MLNSGNSSQRQALRPTAVIVESLRKAPGRDLLLLLCNCLKKASLYGCSHEKVRPEILELMNLLNMTLELEGEVTLSYSDGYIYLNSQRSRITLDDVHAIRYLHDIFFKLNVSGISFMEKVSFQQVEIIIATMLTPLSASPSANIINEYLRSRNIVNIRFLSRNRPAAFYSGDTSSEIRKASRKTYFKAVATVREAYSSHSLGRHIKVSAVMRLIYNLIDHLIGHEAEMIILTALQGAKYYQFRHPVNTCILSLAIGRRLGLNKNQLAELAFASLLHDFGKGAIPAEHLNNPDKMSREELGLQQAHPVLGAKYLARSFKLDRLTGQAILVAFEHHKNCDGSGFPFINSKRELNLFSRIVAICDYYDELTIGNGYRQGSITYDQVLLKIIQQSNNKFDPYLVKVFLNVVGMYPVGSILLLDTGEMALVTHTNPADLFRPTVLIFADESGLKNPAVAAHLSSPDKPHDRNVRNVCHIVDSVKHGIDTSEFILID